MLSRTYESCLSFYIFTLKIYFENVCKKTKKKEISIQLLQIFNKKEDFFLNSSSSEYRNKPNRDENANTKRDMLGLKYRKKNKTSNRGNHSKSRSRSETRNNNNRRDQSKSTERIALPPKGNKTEAQEAKPGIIVENMIKRKETFFQKIG